MPILDIVRPIGDIANEEIRMTTDNPRPANGQPQADDSAQAVIADPHARRWPFAITLHYSPEAPGLVHQFEGEFVGRQAFQVVQRTLDFACEMAGTLGNLGIDLIYVDKADDLTMGLFSALAGRRHSEKGRCRFLVPMDAQGEKLLQALSLYTHKFTPDPTTMSVAVDL